MKPWKVQKFFGDVVYDLRNRGLLPVAILLLVAMVAVPLLIARGSSGGSSSSPQPAAASAEPAPEIQNAVVSYDPGVRNYRQRLDELSPKDPFRQHFAPSAKKASQLQSTVDVPATPATPDSGGSATPTSTPPSGGSTTVKETHHVTLYRASADVSFGDATQPLVRHKSLKSYASLPNELAPVLIYVGSTLDRKRALFAVPKNTSLIGGEGICAPDPTTCSLLALGPGHYEDVLYGADGLTYRVMVNGIRLTQRGVKPKRFTK